MTERLILDPACGLVLITVSGGGAETGHRHVDLDGEVRQTVEEHMAEHHCGRAPATQEPPEPPALCRVCYSYDRVGDTCRKCGWRVQPPRPFRVDRYHKGYNCFCWGCSTGY